MILTYLWGSPGLWRFADFISCSLPSMLHTWDNHILLLVMFSQKVYINLARLPLLSLFQCIKIASRTYHNPLWGPYRMAWNMYLLLASTRWWSDVHFETTLMTAAGKVKMRSFLANVKQCHSHVFWVSNQSKPKVCHKILWMIISQMTSWPQKPLKLHPSKICTHTVHYDGIA